MTQPPVQPKIYHIVNVDRLPSIIAHGRLLCDSEIVKLQLPGTTIGMGSIKARRLHLPVTCYANAFVGDFVPFYFCPRSVMLYVIHCANDPDLTYRGGQEPIVHLEADLRSVVAWANQQGRRWAFSLSNAGALYAEFRTSLQDLADIDWRAVASTDFRSDSVKEGKQAEFLLHGDF